MALTKTQINYLRDKLNNAVDKKISEVRQSNKVYDFQVEVLNRLEQGTIKLLPAEKFVKKHRARRANTYYTSILTEDLISDKDVVKIKNYIQKQYDKIQSTVDKIYEYRENALDKIVLDGLDFSDVVKGLDKIK